MRPYGSNTLRGFDRAHDYGPQSKHWSKKSVTKNRKRDRRALKSLARNDAKVRIHSFLNNKDY